jgi:hypothetical protein
MCEVLEIVCKLFLKSCISVGGTQLRCVKTREARGISFFSHARSVKILADLKKNYLES